MDVPSSVGFLQGDGPALRVWYGDPTLSGGLFSSYRVRDPRSAPGPDRFFRFDSTAGWVEIRAGAEDVAASRAADPRWREDHERLAIALSRGEDWPRAAAEYAKLAAAFPDSVNYVYYAGLAAVAAGDSTGGRAWLERALRLPGSDDEIRATARRLGAGRPPGRPVAQAPRRVLDCGVPAPPSREAPHGSRDAHRPAGEPGGHPQRDGRGGRHRRLRRRAPGAPRDAASACAPAGAVVWRGPRRGRPLVVLAGHLDTVPAQGNEKARLVGDRLYGLGASDMKGGARGDDRAARVARSRGPALRPGRGVLRRRGGAAGGRRPGPACWRTCPGWARRSWRCCSSPPTRRSRLGCNGVLNVEVRVPGRSAHAARPWTGVNAVERAAPWLARDRALPGHAGASCRASSSARRCRSPRCAAGARAQHGARRAGRPTSTTASRPTARRRRPRRACARWCPPTSTSRSWTSAAPGQVCLDRPLVREFVERTGRPA